MKRTLLVTSILTLLVPAFTIAGTDTFVANKALPGSGDELVTVPIEVTNSQPLVALDIPLEFSEGATLESVTFGDRVASFEFKYPNIDNANRRVVIGLISMLTSEMPDLAPGTGVVANLHFKLAPGVSSVMVTPVDLTNPDHTLSYYYNDYSSGQPEVKMVKPEIQVGKVEPQDQVLPKSYALVQNSPNPFNPSTKISFALPQGGDVKLSVFNVLGQEVRELVNQPLEAGVHDVIWDGKDHAGSQVASGIYFYRIKATNFSDTKKMLLLK